MNFEKKMQKRGNQKLDQFAKNPYHKEKPKVNSFPLWGKILIPTAGVSLALLLGFSIALLPTMGSKSANIIVDKGSNNNWNQPAGVTSHDYGNKDPQSQQAPGGEASNPVISWDDFPLIQQYPSFTYGDYTYSVHDVSSSEPINSAFVKTKLNDISVLGYDSIKDKNHFINASIYTIKQIHEKVSLAIRFENSDSYYAYNNANYDPDSLSDFLEDTCIASEAFITKATTSDLTIENYVASTRNFSNLSAIANILMSDKSPVNTKEYNTQNATDSIFANHNEVISLTLQFDCLGIKDASIDFFDDGLMCANLFGNKIASFNIGQDRYLQIKDCVIK